MWRAQLLKIAELSPYGCQLTRFGLVNCYLVRESDGCTLIDTGVGGSAEAILVAARERGLGDIRRILLTHAHGDHIGSLDALCARLNGKAEVAISARDARLLPKRPAQDRSLDPSEPQCPVKGSFPGANTQPTHFVTDGELYGSLRCFNTAGHTPGHFSFLDERDGTLYAGDALVTVGGRAQIPGYAPWYFPLPNWATWHRPTAAASLRRLLDRTRQTPIRRIAAGHGPVLQASTEMFEAVLLRTR
jgi:glyoxylase-like metal-dependent hydrolase (beta-lactamase superfamily II)